MFINGDGEIVHRSLGYHSEEQFLALGGDAINPMRQLASLDKMYADGKRDADFLYQYTDARFGSMDGSHLKVAEEYIATQSNLNSSKNLTFIYKYIGSTEGKLFDYLVNNKAVFINEFGERAIEGKIQALVEADLFKEDSDPIANAEQVFPRVYPEKANEMVSSFKMSYYQAMGETDKFANAAINHFKNFDPQGAEELNEVAWAFYEGVDNKKQLKQAIKWSKKSIELDSNYYNNDTLAALYYKLGKKGKALKAANNAIALAKASGENPVSTERLLEDIKKM